MGDANAEGERIPSRKEKDSTFGSCFALGNLIRAADRCACGTSWKHTAQSFMAHRLTECQKLQDELSGGTYKPSKTKEFDIVERGKPRHIRPVAFRDRVAQRCFVDNALYPLVESMAQPNTSSCLKGRGLSYAMEDLRRKVADAPDGAWVAQYDFSGYFASIDRAKAAEPFLAHLDAPSGDFLMQSMGGEGVGLQLGSHICQLLATVYPTAIDEAYPNGHRYMDDGAIVCDSKAEALEALDGVREVSEALGLKLNPKKTFANSLRSPSLFCKTRFAKDGSVCRVNLPKRQTRKSVRHARRAVEAGADARQVNAALQGYLSRSDADLSRLGNRLS